MKIWVCGIWLGSRCGWGGGRKSCWVEEEGDRVKMRYGRKLCVVKFGDYRMVCMGKGWDRLKILDSYVLSDKSEGVGENVGEGSVVGVGLEGGVVYCVVDGSVVKELGEGKSMKGVCKVEYFKMGEVEDGWGNGEMVDWGKGMNGDIEKIMEVGGDGMMVCGFEKRGG